MSLEFFFFKIYFGFLLALLCLESSLNLLKVNAIGIDSGFKKMFLNRFRFNGFRINATLNQQTLLYSIWIRDQTNEKEMYKYARLW